MISQTGVVAVPAAADAWVAVEEFTVPAGVKRIDKVKFSLACDFGAAMTSIRVAPVFRLQGSGLLEQSPHEYLGNFGGLTGVVIGAGTVQDDVIEYDVDIPVQTGGTIEAQVNTLDEAITAGTVRCELEFDEETPTLKNSMSQYGDAALGVVADVWAEVDTITVPRTAEGKSPTRIRELAIGVAPDQGAAAVSLRVGVRVRLSGSGIGRSGALEFLASAAGNEMLTDGILVYSNMTKLHKVNIPVNAGGQILIEQIVDVETPTAGTIAVGLLYD
ncbi:MAG: hypothetical protein NWE89_04740 [Candidatus Bathyarchaeota archaeon]|nr:hypothetical protein [Candidatus Bathyarchaeota archaeon]